jgi:hypothetical protein
VSWESGQWSDQEIISELMFGWFRADADRASRRNRSSNAQLGSPDLLLDCFDGFVIHYEASFRFCLASRASAAFDLRRRALVPLLISFNAAVMRASFFAQRACTALRAASVRSSGERFRAVAFPPLRPSETAAESFGAIATFLPHDFAELYAALRN